ncbi:hypothetical protein [Bdellovibrio svalbardensis]|uniref:DUF1311 domain-containing protein n=1 Tax=Bdellovibrio svalbardensis TaxID=2972972 RepID=A0ABT6DH24_9BACT|nr:hypothetical protein [Bdellovibrio svalbardensis]MDG0815799.1 hypothetical protein [Bdellovibrio svalbardensis]
MISFLMSFAIAFAGSVPSLDEAQKTWKSFRACAAKKSEPKLLACADEYLSSKLVSSEKSKLIEFLDQGIPFSSLSDCTEASPVLPARRNPQESFYCMHLAGLKKEAHGYVGFVKEGEVTKIQLIKFKL